MSQKKSLTAITIQFSMQHQAWDMTVRHYRCVLNAAGCLGLWLMSLQGKRSSSKNVTPQNGEGVLIEASAQPFRSVSARQHIRRCAGAVRRSASPYTAFHTQSSEITDFALPRRHPNRHCIIAHVHVKTVSGRVASVRNQVPPSRSNREPRPDPQSWDQLRQGSLA